MGAAGVVGNVVKARFAKKENAWKKLNALHVRIGNYVLMGNV